MQNSKSRVGIFMAAGIVIAIVTGVFVWNTSSSERTAQAGYVSETDTQTPRKESPISKTSKVTSESASKGPSLVDAPSSAPARPHNSAPQAQVNLDERSSQHTAQRGNYNLNSDPYAPQHAVVGTAHRQPATRVFRPTNVVPTTVIATTAVGGPAGGTGASGSGTSGAGSASGSGDSSGAGVGAQNGGEPNHPSTSATGAPRPGETGGATGAPATEPTASAPNPVEDGGDTDDHGENAPRPTGTTDPMTRPDGAAPPIGPSSQEAADNAGAAANADAVQTGGTAAATGAQEAASVAEVVETPRELAEQGLNHSPAPSSAPSTKKANTQSHGFSSDAQQAWDRLTRPFQR